MRKQLDEVQMILVEKEFGYRKKGDKPTHAAVSTKVVPQKLMTYATMQIVEIVSRLRFTVF